MKAPFDYRTFDPDLTDYRGTPISSPYFQGPEALGQYCHDVLAGIRCAGKYEIATVNRFCDDLERTDIRFDLNIASLIFAVANSLKHSKGPIAGQNILLLPWMAFNLLNSFCWVYTSEAGPELAGQRRFQKAITHVGRGNAKTQLAAIVAVVSLLLTKNGQPTVTTSASTRKQASICFNEIKSQIESSAKAIKKRFQTRASEILLKGGGQIYATSSEAGTIDGVRVVTGILDELHTHPDSKIHDVITSGTSASLDPLVYCISTAGNPNTFYHSLYKYACTVLNRDLDNDRLFIQIFEADIELPDDSETAFEQANPSIDHAVSRSTLRSNYVNSLASPAARAGFATKHLNRFFEFHESGFVDTDTIENCIGDIPSEEELKTMSCYVGIDLAFVSDLSVISLVFVGKNKLYLKTHSYLPRAAMDAVPSNILRIYRSALESGRLSLTEGTVTDLDMLHTDLISICKKYKPVEVGIDAAAGGHRFALQHEEEWNGYQIQAVNQGFGLSEPASRLVRGMYDGTITFDNNEHLLQWAFANSRVETGQYGDLKVCRPKNDTNLKIDPVVATLIALSLVPATDYQPVMRTL